MAEAGWFPDPVSAAELRWFDGDGWTTHVSTGGRAWSSPLEGETETQAVADAGPPEPTPPLEGEPEVEPTDDPAPASLGRDPLGVESFVVSRPGQPRGPGAWLDLYDDDGPLGRFVESTSDELDGAVIIRLNDQAGAPIVTVVHPGTSARARVDGPAGTVGFVSRVGRVRANYELHGPGVRPEGEPVATFKPLKGGGGWEGRRADGELLATLRAWPLGVPTETTYGEARYALEIEGSDGSLLPLLLAVPVVVDRSGLQSVAPAK